MATIQSRPFSKDYSGLINQSVIGSCMILICVTSHEVMKRRRRGKRHSWRADSVESWEFGYLYQGRSWARRPSPLHPHGWPLSWVKSVVAFPEDRFNKLRGIDATLYIRFLRGCFWYTLLHSLTTLPVLLPIHVAFSDDSVSPKSMTRASISSLVLTSKGLSLLWIHLILLIWITTTWMALLVWLCRGAFRLRAQNIVAAAAESERSFNHPHPHPQYPFHVDIISERENSTRGIRLRTVMVTNVPPNMRSEKDLREYFEYYLSRPVAKPTIGITSSTQPGFLNKSISYLLNRVTPLLTRIQVPRERPQSIDSPAVPTADTTNGLGDTSDTPVIERVVLVRRMTELASLLERREEVLRLLETAHIKLARRALTAVQQARDMYIERSPPPGQRSSIDRGKRLSLTSFLDSANEMGGESRMELLMRTLGPFVPKPDAEQKLSRTLSLKRLLSPASSSSHDDKSRLPPAHSLEFATVWDALLSLPRSTLDVYQPLIHLSALFRGRTVPSIDYYTAKLEILTSLITEKRAKHLNDYEPMSTAFVTFADPADARRACKYLAVHPANPLQCFVTMAPSYEDLDWIRLMKPTFRVEFVKDWLVSLGVWGFTVFWVFPLSIFVGLVSIQNISTFWPWLEIYLSKHPWQEELIQSFLPTLLVSLLSLLIPLLLLFIAKKAHTIATMSALHDRIMMRYYKFLIVNVLVFFCVGTAALQSILVSFSADSGLQVLQIVADSFPTAGPFYVGWLIFTMAMHGGIELALFGLPILLYPSTRRQVTPRKRAIGIRPRTFNYYYWLPNHVLVVHILLVFAVLNPLVIPFGLIYFSVQTAVIKNQLLHVYAKNYEGNGQAILIRLIRYTLDGLILAQVVFLAYMVVLKKTVNVAVSAILIILTTAAKLLLTRICRARFERDDLLEAQAVCGNGQVPEAVLDDAQPIENSPIEEKVRKPSNLSLTLPMESRQWPFPSRIDDGYATMPRHPYRHNHRQPIPFRSGTDGVLHAPRASVDNPLTIPNRDEFTPLARDDEYNTKPVVPHPPHPAWDDECSPDHSYDNPYYTRTIQDELWLPRDPLGLLDLDDTVKVRLSLTTQPGSGQLGAWRQDELLSSNLSSILASAGNDRDGISLTSHTGPRRLRGNEQINLPFEIVTRVTSVDREEEFETAPPTGRCSSHFQPRRSRHRSGSGFRHPSDREHGPSTGSRSVSFSDAHSRPANLSSSFLPIAGRRARSVSTDREMGVRRSKRAPSQSSRFVLPQPVTCTGNSGNSGSVITLREAVIGEAIVEEEAAQELLREAEAEEEQAEKPRSWLTAWMFAKWQ
ncbi:hypothetical protein WOLCODRAFT_116507 [Wolfiporia cocos MD-104 SS10]|uniref:DUF221-domain-containing protein n=1 Tax=Wolfiporia cocos (strain MD-104) TaxID=742152 RepID=A0A2H3JCP5_WOLCO|nr:hypothetical protein WOLCODRAFT_116507 [Wolfiporia cocos MD-104 SS10]